MTNLHTRISGQATRTKASKFVQQTTLLTWIREVNSSYLVSDTDYTDSSFSWISSAPPDEYHDRFIPNPFKLIERNHPPMTSEAK